MIYTITLNPAIDYFMNYSAEGSIKKWAKTSDFQLQYGGKGINASVLLKNIDVENIALVLTGGSIGKILLDMLEQHEINYKNFDTGVNTRINVKAQFDDTYELLTDSMNKNSRVAQQLINYLKNNLKAGDMVMIMGSTMTGLPKNYIGTISKLVKDKLGELIYDLSGPELLKMARYKPLVIKPNILELANIFNVKIKTKDDIAKYAKKLIIAGAQNVIISHDAKGAWIYNKSFAYRTNPLKINLVNGAGSGDSMLAGFLSQISKGKDIDESLDFANACGAGTASVRKIADKKTIMSLYKKVNKNKKEKYA